MDRTIRRGLRAALMGVALVCCAYAPARAAGPEAVLPPFTYWDMQIALPFLYCQGLPGWPLPAGGSWREQFPSPGVLHVQSRFVDRDLSGFISHGDSIEATGLGPGVWCVESATTEFSFEAAGLPSLIVTSDKFYWGCRLGTHCSPCDIDPPPCPPSFPAPGDSFYVLSPDFNQILTVLEWIRHDFIFGCTVAPSDSAVLSGPTIPPASRYVLSEIRCGVWLSWDRPVDARRASWGWVKEAYHR